jgi:hypothetical protein
MTSTYNALAYMRDQDQRIQDTGVCERIWPARTIYSGTCAHICTYLVVLVSEVQHLAVLLARHDAQPPAQHLHTPDTAERVISTARPSSL